MTPEEREAKRKRQTDTQDIRSDSQRVEACNTGADDIVDNVNEDAITNLVEHPQQLRPPSELFLVCFRFPPIPAYSGVGVYARTQLVIITKLLLDKLSNLAHIKTYTKDA